MFTYPFLFNLIEMHWYLHCVDIEIVYVGGYTVNILLNQ